VTFLNRRRARCDIERSGCPVAADARADLSRLIGGKAGARGAVRRPAFKDHLVFS